MPAAFRDRIIAADLLPPRILTLSITNGCNLRCAHCWPDSGAEGISAPVPAETVRRIAAEFADMGGETVILTGGEPLTHPDWRSLLDFSCRSAGLREVVLQTNATLIDTDIAQDLSAPDLPDLHIQVSLDGASPATHDRLRGAGAFHRAMIGIENLCAVGMGPRIRIAFTEMRHNFHEIPDLLEMLDRMGVGRLIAGAVIKGGRAAGSDDLRLPTPNQYRDLLARYEQDKTFRDRYDRMGTLSAIEWFKQGDDADTACGCIETPYIDGAGRLFPCGLFQDPALGIPGVHHRPLSGIVARGLRRWPDIHETSRRRPTEIPDCRDCPNLSRCGAGCMGRAFSAYGTVMAPEDRCRLRHAVYDLGRGIPLGQPQVCM